VNDEHYSIYAGNRRREGNPLNYDEIFALGKSLSSARLYKAAVLGSFLSALFIN